MVTLKTQDWLANDEAMLSSMDKWQRAVDLMTGLLGATAGYVVEYNDKLGFRAALTSQNDANPNRKLSGKCEPASSNIYCRRVAQTKASFYEPDATGNPDWADNPELTDDGYVSYYGVPLFWPNGVVFGTCLLYTSPSPRDS